MYFTLLQCSDGFKNFIYNGVQDKLHSGRIDLQWILGRVCVGKLCCFSAVVPVIITAAVTSSGEAEGLC